MRSRLSPLAVLTIALLPIGVWAQAVPQGSQEQRIQLLERRVTALSNIVLRVDRLQNEVQQLRGDIELQTHAMEALKKRQRDLYLDVDQRLGQLAVTGSPSGAPVTPGAASSGESPPTPVSRTPEVSPSPATTASRAPGGQPVTTGGAPALEAERYQAAFDLLMQRRYDEARSAFSEFLASYPGGKYSDNAQYWLAEASYVTRDFGRAEAEFTRVIEQYPQSAKVADAMLKKGFIQYEQKQWKTARNTLTTLVNNYPASTAARLAEKRLEKMAAEGR